MWSDAKVSIVIGLPFLFHAIMALQIIADLIMRKCLSCAYDVAISGVFVISAESASCVDWMKIKLI